MGEQVAARYSLPVSSTNEKGIPTEDRWGCTLKTEYREYQKQKDIRGRHGQMIMIGTQVVNKKEAISITLYASVSAA